MVMAATAFGLVACSQPPVAPGTVTADDAGSVVLALQVTPGVTIASASYAITGPGGFMKTGSINLVNSSSLAATIAGLPAGNGFSISINATSTDGSTTCAGAATFNVSARMTTAVSIHLTCHEAPRTGTISVTGSINICPVVDGVSANPAQVVVGASIALSVAAHDSDAGPTALAYHWSAGSGTFSDATAASPTFVCTTPSTVTISVSASDGDTTPGCTDSGSVQVRCSLPGAGGPATLSTMAVYGDAPYGTTPTDNSETLATPAFVASVNADPDVSMVLHVGNIHSGKQFCTQAYDQTIFDMWTAYVDPLVYTPGDNEWTDCQKTKEMSSGAPLNELAKLRTLFFPHPGKTLGGVQKSVLSQAQAFDPAHPSDAAFVENVMWEKSNVLFVAINLPGGSNNDQDVWYAAPTATAAQTQEIADRTGADLRWLDLAFAQAQADGVAAVVIQAQADMWDPEKGAAHQTGYEAFVMNVANHTTAFGKPILMFNGDSHVYQVGNPMDPTNAVYAMHPFYNVPNFFRIVVHGSTTPLEWLKVSIDPSVNAPPGSNAFGPFAWTRMIQP